ncbi:hypothetical protein [Burkholderia gladioli]|uniref:hypothetical protein n=1 Tax=Burkholderia gladioli TaxID=28095 RepID=UPI00163E36F6|nr:hypothetical protein [Burkholderia gladioli]
MAVTINMPDGTIKTLGTRKSKSAGKRVAGVVAKQRKSHPSTGARRLKAALDRLDQVDLSTNNVVTTPKKPARTG